MIHQLDHTSTDASACTGYVSGRDSLTPHRSLITCRACRQWLKDASNAARAHDLAVRCNPALYAKVTR
jgi:hypothetical protein